jgi:hypothetical protein
MNAPARLPATIVRPVADLEDMLGVGDPGVAAVLWDRPTDAAFGAWIDALAPERLPRLRAAMPHPRARDAVRAACEKPGRLKARRASNWSTTSRRSRRSSPAYPAIRW